jgi:hypothetical protein
LQKLEIIGLDRAKFGKQPLMVLKLPVASGIDFIFLCASEMLQQAGLFLC